MNFTRQKLPWPHSTKVCRSCWGLLRLWKVTLFCYWTDDYSAKYASEKYTHLIFLSPRWMTLFHHLKLMNWNTKDPSIKTQCRPPSLTEDYFVASLKEALACNDLNQAVNKAKIIIDDLSLWQTIMEFHFGSSSKYHLLVKRHFFVRQKGQCRIRHILGGYSLQFKIVQSKLFLIVKIF